MNTAHRLAGAAVALILLTPLLMIVSREIPATMLVVVASCLGAAALSQGTMRPLARDLKNRVMTVGGLAALALIGLAGLSSIWSPVMARGAFHALHFGGSLILTAIAVVAIGRIAPRFSAKALAFAIASTAFLATIDLATNGAVRGSLGLRSDAYLLNRVAVALVLLLPLASALVLRERRLVLLALVWVACVATIGLSISHSAKFALLIALLVLPAALYAPRLSNMVVGTVAVTVVLAMPWLGLNAYDLIPRTIHESFNYGSLTIRGEIWRETAAFVWQRPLLGWGIEASHVFSELPATVGLTDAQRAFLGYGHPHNAPLQIWLELGGVGALLAATALGAGFIALDRLPSWLLPFATTTAAAAFTIACVSHGAWQAWWWGILGIVAVSFAAAVASVGEPASRPYSISAA